MQNSTVVIYLNLDGVCYMMDHNSTVDRQLGRYNTRHK